MARLLLLLTLLPSITSANQLRMIDDPALCSHWAKPETEAIDVVADGAMVLTAQGMDTIEYYCEFDRPITFEWTNSTQIRPGYCEEPGPYIMPTVFVMRMYEGEEDKVHVYQSGSDEAHVFYVCGAGTKRP